MAALIPPTGPLVAYYGDDFTGSTDVLDAFSSAGIPTVLFFQPPQPAELARFPQARCIGLAGTARGQGPGWMNAHLPAAFQALAALGAPLLQYKVCSTFDSSPQVGSIGRAIDLGLAQFGATAGWSPVIVGAPTLRRYMAFGHLFAASGEGPAHRLDRHPTMARHPVTPMGEADLRLHLAQQTGRRIELIDFVQLKAGRGAQCLAALRGADSPIVLLDVIDPESLAAAGQLVWAQRGAGLFSASSSGLNHALAAYWSATEDIVQAPPAAYAEHALSSFQSVPPVPPVPPVPSVRSMQAVMAVSGSCSPVTAAQIDQALGSAAFEGLRVELAALFAPDGLARETGRLALAALAALHRGRSPLVYSACGPDDPAVRGLDALAAGAGLTRAEATERIGQLLGSALCRTLDAAPGLRRVLVAGGDSAGAVVGALGLRGLTVVRPLSPGAPLCRAFSADARRDGLELVLKGGQMGGVNFFQQAAQAGQ